ARRAHLVNAHTGEAWLVVGVHVLHAGRLEHLRHVVRHVLAHEALVLARSAVDLDHGQAPFVLPGLVERDDVRVVRQHLTERGAAYRPCARFGDHILEAAADAELRNRARPALSPGRALVAEATEVLPLLAKEI